MSENTLSQNDKSANAKWSEKTNQKSMNIEPNKAGQPSILSRLRFWGILILAVIGIAYYYFSRPSTTTQYGDVVPVLAGEIDRVEQLAQTMDSGFEPGIWPGWRGPTGQGIAPKNSPPTSFGPEKSVRWKTSIPGKGYSSPIIWKDRLFLTTELDQKLYLICLNRENGSERWRKQVGEGQGSTHKENGFASSTPVTDGERVYTFFGATGLFCHDFQGEEVWKVNLGNLRHIHGLASSPLLYNNLVIQLCDNASDSYIAAFDKRSGQEIWRKSRPSGGGWTTPVVATGVDQGGNKRDELLVNGNCPGFTIPGTFVAYDPQTGSELWSCSGPVGWGIPTPVCSLETVYVLCGLNGRVEAIRLGGKGDVSSTHLLWDRTKSSPYIPSGLLYRNRLYVPSDRGRIDCLNPGSGEPVYEKKVGDTFYASLVAADGKIYAIGRNGKALVLEAGDEGKVLSETDFEETCFASPAIADHQLFIRTESTLFCFE
ncbi:MAG: PQQ-binding-like beta-propeller repeat protein [Thermoguttaceae bacterium]